MKRTHSPRKPYTPGKRPARTVDQFMKDTLKEVRKAFLVPVHVTITVRVPGQDNAEIVYSDDSVAELIGILQRNLDAVTASQQAAGEPT